jgi:hypothetical protein
VPNASNALQRRRQGDSASFRSVWGSLAVRSRLSEGIRDSDQTPTRALHQTVRSAPSLAPTGGVGRSFAPLSSCSGSGHVAIYSRGMAGLRSPLAPCGLLWPLLAKHGLLGGPVGLSSPLAKGFHGVGAKCNLPLKTSQQKAYAFPLQPIAIPTGGVCLLTHRFPLKSSRPPP